MHIEVAKQLAVPFIPLQPPIPATALNKQVFALITHETEPVHSI